MNSAKKKKSVKPFSVMWPIVRRALFSGQIFKPQCILTQPIDDILFERDVKIPVPDGFNLTANIFRSRKAQESNTPLPVVMCAHPYDNNILPALGTTPFDGPPQQYRLIPQSGGIPRFSTQTSWEAPDPNFWVSSGYAVVNLNMPGFGTSEGPATAVTDHQAKCFYEAIEWIARQPWCTGKIGLNGVSFLAISQFHVAACRHYGGAPPSLCCISPWEGLTDIYRDLACPGGIDDQGFGPFWWTTEIKPALRGDPEQFIKDNDGKPAEMIEKHPDYDEFWKEKTPDLEKITIPMLVCGSFSDHGMHTVGSFRAFIKAKSKYKWVYTHRTGKWVSYYSPEVQQLTKEFMDCFLKGDTANGFLDRAPVRLEVRSNRDTIYAIRHEKEWPLARTDYQRLYLSAEPQKLTSEQPSSEQIVEYPAHKGKITFRHTFSHDTELTGYMKLRLWVEARADRSCEENPPDDMDLFLAVNKLDSRGQTVNFFGSIGNAKDMVTRGLCRVSRRELDPAESKEWQPVLLGGISKPLVKGEIVPVDIELYPSATFFAADESIELIVASHEIIPSPPYVKDGACNRGLHVIHCGGKYDSYLLVPVIPA
ncbi:MAG: CocE/NonD family hydrolase [Deltaproteobacteria bacterium]|nr:CocE/NonD family hydrolase [Deltaproteobacteria bacterium]